MWLSTPIPRSSALSTEVKGSSEDLYKMERRRERFAFLLPLDRRIRLNNGADIPTLDLSVFRAPERKQTYRAVRAALEIGYRHIDTATAYGNEQDIGQAIRESDRLAKTYM